MNRLIFKIILFAFLTLCNTNVFAQTLPDEYIVENLTVRAANHAAYLKWNPEENADGYVVLKYDESNNKYKHMYITTIPRKSVLGLENGKEVTFSVISFRIIDGKQIYSKPCENITVTPVNNKLALERTILILEPSDTYKLDVVIYDKKVGLRWFSTNERVVSVDNNGTIKALSKGNAIVYGQSKTGEEVSCFVSVNRSAPEAKFKTSHSRFINKDGVYTNSESNKKNEAKLLFLGDLMSVAKQQKSAVRINGYYDFNGSFKLIKPIFESADFVIGNLETELSQSYTYTMEYPNDAKGVPICNAPSSYLDAIRYSGIDFLVTANNHSCDAGAKGLVETIDHLNSYKFPNTGCFKCKNEKRHLIADVNNIKLGILSYSQLNYNGKANLLTPEQQKYMLNTYNKETLITDIQNAKTEGAELIIVYIHWGGQNAFTPNKLQIKTAQQIADAGADIIIGSHPHVLQKYDEIISKDGRKVKLMYSMGNFASSMDSVDDNRNTIVLEAVIKKNESAVSVEKISYIPCRIIDTHYESNYVIAPLSYKYAENIFSEKDVEKYKKTISQRIGDKLQVNNEYRADSDKIKYREKYSAISRVDNISAYLDIINSSKYAYIITSNTESQIPEIFRQSGYKNSYILVNDGTKNSYEKYNKLSKTWYADFYGNAIKIKNINDEKKIFSLEINGINHTINKKGVHILVFDKEKNELVDYICFSPANNKIYR